MLEISYAYGALAKRPFYLILNVENYNESFWMTAESHGRLVWGSKALRGNLSPSGVGVVFDTSRGL